VRAMAQFLGYPQCLAEGDQAVEDARTSIQESKHTLDDMKSNPEAYFDPLTVFELRLRQYELMIKAGKELNEPYSAGNIAAEEAAVSM
jgi:hypothetical protein